MRRGSSGATITMTGDDVMKRHFGHGDAVVAQGEWLMRNKSPAVPEVYRVYAESYVMERLFDPPNALLDHDMVIRVMINQLRLHIWSQPALVPINHQVLYDKISALVDKYQVGHIWTQLYKIRGAVNWSRLPTCLTHGDPTYDNVMLRVDTGELVLVDPLPATLAIPDLRSVDIGKMLQSVLGWEAVRYGSGEYQLRVAPAEFRATLSVMIELSEEEWIASIFWCVVHFLRTLPYVPPGTQVGVRRLISDAFTLL